MKNNTLRAPSNEERRMFTADIYPMLAEQLAKYKKTRLSYLLVSMLLLTISFTYLIFVRNNTLLFTIFASSPLMLASCVILNRMDDDIAMATEILDRGKEGKYLIRDDYSIGGNVLTKTNNRTIIVQMDDDDMIEVCSFHEEEIEEEEEN